MAHELDDTDRLKEPPLVLIIPGLNNSGENHWQTRWEAIVPECARVDLGCGTIRIATPG